MAIAAARVGARAGYVTHVGDDAFGRMLLGGLWQEEGVATRGCHHRRRPPPTGVYFVTHGAQGHEFSYLRAGSAASRMTPATLPLELIRGAAIPARFGHQPGHLRERLRRVRSPRWTRARAAGVRVSYDTNLRLDSGRLPAPAP